MNQCSITIKYWLLGKLSPLLFLNRDPRLFADLETFVCFVGHGRSGSTLVGHLLNAHPNIVIANELHSFRLLDRGLTEKQLYRLIYLVSGRQVVRGSRGGGGYTYAVPNQWQGAHEGIRVIGDRKAGATAREIFEKPHVLDKVNHKITLRKKFIHVIRNPFDAITTSFKKTRRRSGETPRQHLEREIELFFARCSSVKLIETNLGSEYLMLLHHEALIEDARGQIAGLCRFLGVECPDGYLDDCASIVMDKPSQTRWSIDWDQDLEDRVTARMGAFSWLQRYLEEPAS